jgi:catechol 2,3-dioxygenase-like lactoylglutathione lyase family enzyme
MVAPELTESNRKESSMELETSYPVVVTDKLIECRDFYTRWFGFRVVFEATWFVYLTSSEEGQHGIAFMKPDHPSRPPGPEAFDNEGILLTLQVPDAASEFERVETSDSSSTTRPTEVGDRLTALLADDRAPHGRRLRRHGATTVSGPRSRPDDPVTPCCAWRL